MEQLVRDAEEQMEALESTILFLQDDMNTLRDAMVTPVRDGDAAYAQYKEWLALEVALLKRRDQKAHTLDLLRNAARRERQEV